jgi:crescentin
MAAQIQPELARSKQRIAELETALHAAQLDIQAYETRAFQDQKERETFISKHAAEKSDLEASLAAMSLHADNISSRHGSTLKYLEQARALCNEKIEAAQKWERSSKEALAALAAAERRFTSAEENIRKLSEQNKSLEHAVAENRTRNDMIAKAMAAKDVIIAQLENKSANFEQRHAAIAQELENEKQRNESARCKLVEELESERAERALVQGALAIARGSREKIAAQMEALKRAKFPLETNSNLSETEKQGLDSGERETNVHFFRPNDSEGA